MNRCRILILYSNCLFAEGMESFLKREPNLEVVGIEPCEQEALASVGRSQPDVVVIDANERWGATADIAHRVLQDNPAIRVVFLSMSDNNIDVYHRHQLLATRGEDLVEAIQMA